VGSPCLHRNRRHKESMSCFADDHEASDDLAAFIDCQDKVYLVCEHCAALWDGERWLE